MDTVLKEHLQEALDVLGMKPNASRAMIQSRARRLKGQYKNSNQPEDSDKLEAIKDAETFLLDNIGHLSELNSETVLPDNDDNESNKERKINFKLIAMILVPLLIILASITTFILVQNNREARYQEITVMMMKFTNNTAEPFEHHINELPENYEDVAEIKAEFNQVMTEIDILEASEIRIDYKAKRAAYYRLETFNEKHDDWDLSIYLERIGVGKLIELLGIRWENTSYYFYIFPDLDYDFGEDNALVLDTNLPNEKEDGVEYWFTNYEAYTSFGFQNKENQYDFHVAYRIISLTPNEMTLYVYKTLEQVTLYPSALENE